jgi:hypothetical protein
MQLITLAAITALSATASAYSGIKSNWFNSTCKGDQPRARIVNNCPYKVYAWTVDSDDSKYDCKFHEGLEIAPGGFYWENYRPASTGAISIKIGKEERCHSDGSILQLEYNIVPSVNFLDVSYVNCQKKNCPTAAEGWKLVSGNEGGKYKTEGLDESVCPIITCSSIEDCAKHSYINPDDIATKSCDKKANLDFFMCGESGSYPAPVPSKKPYKAPAPTIPAYIDDAGEVEAPAYTPAPEHPKVVKTEIVYKTVHVDPHKYSHRRRHANHHHA